MPTLPPEIWSIIHRFAVHIPFLFDTEWRYTPDIAIWQGWRMEYSVELESLKTRQSLVHVSKAWREMSTELLYEYVTISRGSKEVIARLCDALEQSQITRGRSIVYGQWVKRLHLPQKAITNEVIPYTIRLCSACPHIRILVVGAVHGNRMPSGFDLTAVQRLHQSLSDSPSHRTFLRRLQLDTEDFTSFVGPMRAVNVPSSIPYTSLDIPLVGGQDKRDPNSFFLRITTLNIDLPFVFYTIPSSLYFPALRHLGLRGMAPDDLPYLIDFMSKHGEMIVSFAMNYDPTCKDLVQLMPNLSSLAWIFNVARVVTPSCEWIIPSTLTHLGIEVADTHDLAGILSAVSHFLDGVHSSSDFRVVRFLDSVVPKYVAEGEAVWTLFRKCECRGVRLEDMFHNLLRK